MKAGKSTWTILALSLTAVAACGPGPGDTNVATPGTTGDASSTMNTSTGQKTDDASPAAIPGELVGTWTLVALDGAPVTEVGKTPTLEILEDGSVGGVGGVNRFHTQLEVTDGRLGFGPAAATKMAGPPEAMELESTFLTRLGAVSTFDIDDETLRMWAGDNEALRFVRVED